MAAAGGGGVHDRSTTQGLGYYGLRRAWQSVGLPLLRRWLLLAAGPLGLEVGEKPLAVAVAEAEVAETAALQASMSELRGHVRDHHRRARSARLLGRRAFCRPLVCVWVQVGVRGVEVRCRRGGALCAESCADLGVGMPSSGRSAFGRSTGLSVCLSVGLAGWLVCRLGCCLTAGAGEGGTGGIQGAGFEGQPAD